MDRSCMLPMIDSHDSFTRLTRCHDALLKNFLEPRA
ncbi:hypothetical protein QE438_003505 [Pseudoxanthomonas sp. SORGH_AS 997]|uniref:Uncharacterized protein n=1 Tax=Pseudoxanthomonas winnipegensis TaxID=2480810 RepID=A0AAW8GEZ6_9GAMM|nr:hypothetical protein [Pseudoxanthomonas winnipegensis]MDQ1133557.1 hypothetical protein [Pseudoxanthomonas winnipegensis]MDR6140201.1 hypothetical protein [Pseudoxanthomonas sp. SORGH_AS_0997]